MQRFPLALSLLLLAAASVAAQSSAPEAQKRTVTVRGEGTATATPDQVRLTVQVSVRGETASEAMRSAGAKTQAVLAVLRALGVEEKNIQTSRANVSPVFDYSRQVQPPPIIGYISTNDFSVLFKGKTMEKVGEFMDRAVTAGATSFGSLQFETSQQRTLERDVLAKAAADARARAEVLAKELGAELGPVVSITESPSGGRPLPMYMRAATEAAPATPVMSGELSITVSVDVVFGLK